MVENGQKDDWRHFDPGCENRNWYQALIQATECHKATGRVWVRVKRKWSRTFKTVNFGAQALSWKG